MKRYTAMVITATMIVFAILDVLSLSFISATVHFVVGFAVSQIICEKE